MWREIRAKKDCPITKGIVYRWITYIDDLDGYRRKVAIANFNKYDKEWHWQSSGSVVGYKVVAWDLYIVPAPYKKCV